MEATNKVVKPSDKFITVLPNGTVVTFIEDTHQYFVNDVEVPSITHLIDLKYGNSYNNVNPEILKHASQYGTEVHAELDKLINARLDDPDMEIVAVKRETRNYFDHIEPIYHVDPIMTERIVALYDKDGKVIACGRFDMLCFAMGEKYLVDFKTTSSINRQHVTGQLNLYLTAAYQSGYIDSVDIKLGVVHLSGDTARFMPITKLSPDFYLTFIK